MKKYLIPLFIIILSISVFAVNAFAANRYIRAGATGANNGSSWTNAWPNFAAVNWTRGDTYYIAGGTYTGNVEINTPESGTNWITIKKANATDNGTEGDYLETYASIQAVINGKFAASNGYIEIDGVTGSEKTGHGIKFYHATLNTGGVISFSSATTSPRHIHHIEVRGSGFDYGSSSGDGIYWNSSVANSKGLHISYCFIHQIPRNGVTFGNLVGASYSDPGMIYENNWMEYTGGLGMRYPVLHGQAMQFYTYPVSYLIIRNNIFRNTRGTGIVTFLGGVSTNFVRIYNNLFFNDTGDGTYYGIATSGSNTTIVQTSVDFGAMETLVGRVLTNITKNATGTITGVSGTTLTIAGGMSNAVSNAANDQYSFPLNNRGLYINEAAIYSSSGNRITNVEVYNNTFYNLHKAQIAYVLPSDKTGSIAQNNLWVGCWFTSLSFSPPLTNTGYWNNAVGTYKPTNTETEDPFLNSAEYDFNLKYKANAKDNGVDLSSIFSTDIFGNPRPRGSGWDIGAYEYTKPEPPVNLRITQ